MSWFSGIVVYIIAWWLVFMMALPFGVSHTDKDELAEASGAPRKPYIGRKMLITTVIAAALTYGFYRFVQADLISFR